VFVYLIVTVQYTRRRSLERRVHSAMKIEDDSCLSNAENGFIDSSKSPKTIRLKCVSLEDPSPHTDSPTFTSHSFFVSWKRKRR
jgi:hypothetical protein